MRKAMSGLFRRLIERQEQWTLQTRLVLSYVLILLIPGILISIVLFNQFTSNAVDDAEKKNENTLEIERLNINNNIETIQRAANLSLDQDVHDYISRTTEPDTGELITVNTKELPVITRLQYNNPNIEHIRIFFDNPLINELSPVFWKQQRMASEPWYERLNTSRGVTEWYFSPNDPEIPRTQGESSGLHQSKVAFLKEIMYPLGVHAGILEVDMSLLNFFPKTFGSSGDDQSQIVIFDKQGRLYYNQRQRLLADTGVSPEELGELLNAPGRDTSASFRLSLGGKPFLAVSRDIEPLGARMVNIVSLQNVLDNMRQTRDWLIITNVILIAILSIATYILNKLILKKLHILTDSMKKVRRGDFQFHIPVRGGGEVGELAHHFRKMLRKINELIADAVNKKAASKEIELRSLKNQIDSHFLYNTLENIKMMAEIDGHYPISDALTSLGGLMRYNLKWTSEYVRLQDEVTHMTNYAAIMNVRYENKIKLVTEIPPSLLEQEMLKMTLQPIVENAVKHALDTSSERELTIRIQAEEQRGGSIVAVTDDGCGMPPAKTEQLNRMIAMEDQDPHLRLLMRAPGAANATEQTQGSGIGLRNVHQRIQLYYGKEYGLVVESEEGSYTRVIIRIPYLVLTGGARPHAETADRR